MSDIFLSYKREDEPRAKPLLEALRNAGLEVFWDRDINPGEDWQQRLESELDSARCVLVVWSEASTGPDGALVRDEARRAMNRGALLPVRIDRVGYPLGFGQTQTLDLIDWSGDPTHPQFGALLVAIKIKLELGVKIGERHRTESPPITTKPARRYALALVAVAIVAAAYYVWPKAPAPPSTATSHYHRQLPNASRVLVFVHGIFGDAANTWACNTATWPQLLEADQAFAGTNIYTVAYTSPYWGNAMTIDEIVNNLHSRFEADRLFAHQEVAIVAHSLGGLIIQRYLLTHRDAAAKVRFIQFYSTPQTGAQIAALAQLFSADPLLKHMLPGDHNDYLLNLENEWTAAKFAIPRYCVYEKKPMKGILVVERLSATRGCTDTPIPINEDHSGIVKPCTRDADSYIALRNAILKHPIGQAAAAARTTPANQVSHGAQSPNVSGVQGNVVIQYGNGPATATGPGSIANTGNGNTFKTDEGTKK
ncbi:MAG: TIR domain-containing protein [Acidobacteria bacterium]|nr:TIR domain-containing protein [Acidobacteriota bacterium]